MTAQPFLPCVACTRKLVAAGAIRSGRQLHERLLCFFERHDRTDPAAATAGATSGDAAGGLPCAARAEDRRFGEEIGWLRLRLAQWQRQWYY